jgi:hypothetical protein
MRRTFLCRRLARRPWCQALIGVGISLFSCVFLALLVCDSPRRGLFRRAEDLLIVIIPATGSALGLLLAGLAAVHLSWIYEHGPKDFRPLSRYGPTAEVADAIDAEVLARRRLVRLGTLPTLLHPVHEPGELYGHQVILTESWLLDFWRTDGLRFKAMQLPDLVWARRESALGRPKLVLIDRHDARLEIVGTPAGISHLLAEVLARVPWALGRFEPQAERAGQQGPAGPPAEADRREQFRRADVGQGPPPEAGRP